MPEHFTHDYTGVSCDAHQCKERRNTPKPMNPFGAERKAFERTLLAEGWTFYGGRSLRVYCPGHEPKPGHKMWAVDRG